MALSRTWYNTLVNDDGSGLTGSVWDKEDVNQLMNATDAEILRLEKVWTPYVPTLYAVTGVWSSASAFAQYRIQDGACRICEVHYSIEFSTLTAATTNISIQMPVTAGGWGGTSANPCALFLNSVYEVGLVTMQAGTSVITIVRNLNAAFPATSAFYARGQISFRW